MNYVYRQVLICHKDENDNYIPHSESHCDLFRCVSQLCDPNDGNHVVILKEEVELNFKQVYQEQTIIDKNDIYMSWNSKDYYSEFKED